MAAGAKVFAIVGQESVKCWDVLGCRSSSSSKHGGASDDWKCCKVGTNKGRKIEMVKNMRQKRVGREKGTNTCNSKCCRRMNHFRSRQVSLENSPTPIHFINYITGLVIQRQSLILA